MRNFTELASARSDQPAPFTDQLQLAAFHSSGRGGRLRNAI